MTTVKALHFKWTVSRGRDTYGYNICTLFVDGEKAGRCNGGGYDMTGTSFAQWLTMCYQDELQKLFAEEIATFQTSGKTFDYAKKSGFYGAMLTRKADRAGIVLDGACGFESMKRIAEAIGIKLQWNKESDRYKNSSFYTAIIEN